MQTRRWVLRTFTELRVSRLPPLQTLGRDRKLVLKMTSVWNPGIASLQRGVLHPLSPRVGPETCQQN